MQLAERAARPLVLEQQTLEMAQIVFQRAGLALSLFAMQIHTQPQHQQPARQQSLWRAATAFINGLALGASPSNGFHNRRSCP
jgi:hypothetical protein